MIKRSIGILILLVLSAALAACSGGGGSSSVKLAEISPLTGPNASYGIASDEGLKMAVEEINAAGGVLGKKIELSVDDTASDKAQAVALTRRYGGQPDVIATLGFASTGEFIPSADAAAELKFIAFSSGSAGIWPTEFNDWTFRNTLVSDRGVPAYLNLLKSKLNLKNLAVIHDSDNDFNVLEAKFMRESAPKIGITLTDVESHRQRDTDFSAQLTKMMATNPDAIFIGSRTNEAAAIIQQARQRGFKGPLIGSTTLSDPVLVKLAGDAIDGVYFNQGFGTGNPKTADFMKRFAAKYNGRLPQKEAIQAYDAVYILVDAMKRANSTTDRQKIRDALGATKNFEGVEGTYSYDGKGDNTTQAVYMYQWKKDGTYEQVK